MATDNKWLDNYKDPRWQKKRLEILNRDDWKCRSCGTSGDAENNLNVHHAYYEGGKMPWEYDNQVLISWCNKCHTKRHEIQKTILLYLVTFTLVEIDNLGFSDHPDFYLLLDDYLNNRELPR